MSVRITREEIVIACRDTATATTVDFVEGPSSTALTLCDGDVEIAIERLAGLDATPTDAGAPLLLPPRLQCVGDALPVQDAEWVELDDENGERGPAARPGDSGDAPTRIHRLEEVLGETEFTAQAAPGARGVPASRAADAAGAHPVAASRGRLSVGARRFALLGMLACAMMLWLRSRRAQDVAARAPRAHAPQALERQPAGPADSPGPHDRGVLRPVLDRTAVTHAPTDKGTPTKARRAADALAEGDYTDALELYEVLAAEEANPAYARIVDSLRSRPPTSP